MGYDIVGISKATRVNGRHSDEVCDEQNHYRVGSNRCWLEGHKPGCYIAGGRTYSFYISYGSYATWFDDLSQILWGVWGSEVQQDQRRFRGEPFFELITLPDGNDVAIGPNTSAKLHRDFAANSAKVKRGFQRIWTERPTQRIRTRQGTDRAPVRAARRVARALGGMLVGADDDPESRRWEWKWEFYRDFRRAFKLARDRGFVIISM